MIKKTKKSIPGYYAPAIFNHSLIVLHINGPQTGTDSRGNAIYPVTLVTIKAVLYKKPRINKVMQRLDRVSSYDVFEGNIIEPLEFPSELQTQISNAEGEIMGDATINGVVTKVRLVSIARTFLEPYNRQLGRVIQLETIGNSYNV